MFSFCWRLAPTHGCYVFSFIWSTFLPRRLHAEIFGKFLLRCNTYNTDKKPARVPKMTRSRFSAPDFLAITAHTCAPAVNCRTGSLLWILIKEKMVNFKWYQTLFKNSLHKNQIWSSYGRNEGQERVAPSILLSCRARSGEGGPAWFIYLPLPEMIFLILSFQARTRSAGARRACALGALGLLLYTVQ